MARAGQRPRRRCRHHCLGQGRRPRPYRGARHPRPVQVQPVPTGPPRTGRLTDPGRGAVTFGAFTKNFSITPHTEALWKHSCSPAPRRARTADRGSPSPGSLHALIGRIADSLRGGQLLLIHRGSATGSARCQLSRWGIAATSRDWPTRPVAAPDDSGPRGPQGAPRARPSRGHQGRGRALHHVHRHLAPCTRQGGRPLPGKRPPTRPVTRARRPGGRDGGRVAGDGCPARRRCPPHLPVGTPGVGAVVVRRARSRPPPPGPR